MQDKTLTAQARRAATLLQPLGVKFTHTQALKFLAQTLGYGSYQELKAAQDDLQPLRAPLSPDALRAAADPRGKVTRVVRYPLDTLAQNNPRETEEGLSYALSGGPHLTNVTYTLAGHDGPDLLLRVTACVTAALAQQAVPAVPGIVADEYGYRRVHIDAARALTALGDDELTQILGRSVTEPGSVELYHLVTDTAAWDAELSAFLDDLSPHVSPRVDLDLPALLTFALRTRPHLRETLTLTAQDLLEDGHLTVENLQVHGIAPRLPDVTATVRSDNGAVEETLTINAFLDTLTPRDVDGIIFEDGCGGGYHTDAVVHHYEDENDRLRAMMEMNRALQDAGDDQHGFSVEIDPVELEQWLSWKSVYDSRWTSLHDRMARELPNLLG